jgi:hypothetical protein
MTHESNSVKLVRILGDSNVFGHFIWRGSVFAIFLFSSVFSISSVVTHSVDKRVQRISLPETRYHKENNLRKGSVFRLNNHNKFMFHSFIHLYRAFRAHLYAGLSCTTRGKQEKYLHYDYFCKILFKYLWAFLNFQPSEIQCTQFLHIPNDNKFWWAHFLKFPNF